MSLKIEFVERAAAGEQLAPLCREFGVSRTTGHKWFKRFKERGHEGLEEESRRPRSTPLATAEDLVMATLEAREAHPRWGPQKLRTLLHRRFGAQTPSVRTIARILKRANRVRERKRRAPYSVVEQAPRLAAAEPNDVWTVDFKGWWRVLDGTKCEPLTVRDSASRYLLALEASSTACGPTRKLFEKLFRKHGVPKAIQCDNGTPFISVRSRAGLSALSAWWVSLGIRVVRSRPGCPQDNGGHERMHRDICAEVQSEPAATLAEQQKLLDRWRQEFNHVRPHAALDNKTPAEVYKVAHRRKPDATHTYPKRFYTRRADTVGNISFRGDQCLIGRAFAGLNVGVEVVDALRVRVWLRDVDLGLVETLPAVDASCYEPTRPRPPQRVGIVAVKASVPESSRLPLLGVERVDVS
jgi:putative transposase